MQYESIYMLHDSLDAVASALALASSFSGLINKPVSFLFQRISVLVQHFNSVLLNDNFVLD